MKRLATTSRIAALALLASAACFATAHATVLMADGFTYPNGNLAGNGGWSTFSGTGTDIQVVSGRANGDHNNAPDDQRLFAAQPVTGKTYACFDVIVPTPQPGKLKATYFAMLKDGGTSNFLSRTYIVPIGSNGFTFAISNSSTSATVGVTPWGTSTLLFDHRYNIVINYDPVNKSSTLWVDPVNELSTSVTDVNSGAAAVAISGIGIRQSNTPATLPPSPDFSGVTNAQYSMDNLGVGTTFDDACQQYHTVGSNHSTWGYVKSMYR